MESLRIDIINPKAKQLINSLAEMDLIKIRKEKNKSEFTELLASLRKQSKDIPSFEEITKEVESVRNYRYENKKSNS